MKTNNIGFIGAGRITKIFLQSFSQSGLTFNKVIVFDTNTEVTNTLKKNYPFIEIGTLEEVASQEIVFIALHPPMIMDTLEKIAHIINENSIVISLAPKITIEKIQSKLACNNVVRMIPNATSYISQGYNPISFANTCDEEVKSNILVLLKTLGNTFEAEELKLEAYALVSAMLPTYFWFQLKEIEKLGIEMGLSTEESKNAVSETIEASLSLLYQSELNADQVIDLIPVKPIGEDQDTIKEIYNSKLLGLYQKIKP